MASMRYRKHLTRALSVTAALLLTITTHATAVEQKPSAVVETFEIGRDGYRVPEEQLAVPWPAMMLALLALIVVLGPAFLGSRRSHLD